MANRDFLPLKISPTFVFQRLTFCFEEHKVEPWGIRTNFKNIKNWYVSEVWAEGQARKYGIQVNWRIAAVDHEEIHPLNHKSIMKKLQRGQPSTITFVKRKRVNKVTKLSFNTTSRTRHRKFFDQK